jgi:hypothetical protein
MLSYTCHCAHNQCRSARLDVVKQKASVPDYLVNRPSSLRATLKEQWELGERCAPLVYQMAGTCMLVLGSESFGTCMGCSRISIVIYAEVWVTFCLSMSTFPQGTSTQYPSLILL